MPNQLECLVLPAAAGSTRMDHPRAAAALTTVARAADEPAAASDGRTAASRTQQNKCDESMQKRTGEKKDPASVEFHRRARVVLMIGS